MKTFYNVVNSIICCAKEARASIVLIIESECNLSCKIVKNCCPRYVSLLKKKQRFIVLCTSDVMHKKYKRLGYTSPDLLVRFRKAKLVDHKKIRLHFYSGLPFRQRNATYKLQRVNWLPPRTIVSYNRPL